MRRLPSKTTGPGTAALPSRRRLVAALAGSAAAMPLQALAQSAFGRSALAQPALAQAASGGSASPQSAQSAQPAEGQPVAGQARPLGDRPLRLVVPTPPGSSVDIAARLIAEGLRVRLGTTVLVENKPGAGGTIAAADVARSASDGHSLFVGYNGPLATAPYVFAKLPYQPLESFAPVIATVSQPDVLAVNANNPARTLREFVAWVKAHPGKANYASVGNASAGHLTMELFKSVAGLHIVHIPYSGGPGATQGLVAGDVDAMFTAYVNVQGPVNAGRVRVLALAEKQRSPILPEVPTFAEEGWPAVDAPLWNAIVAPAGTPPPVIATLNEAIGEVLSEPEVRRKLATGGMDVIGGPPERLGQMMRGEAQKWLPVIQRLGIRPD